MIATALGVVASADRGLGAIDASRSGSCQLGFMIWLHPAPVPDEISTIYGSTLTIRWSNCLGVLFAPDSPVTAEILEAELHPKTIKALGRGVPNFNEEVWKKNRYEIVVEGNYLKFTQNEDLKTQLLETGDRELVGVSNPDARSLCCMNNSKKSGPRSAILYFSDQIFGFGVVCGVGLRDGFSIMHAVHLLTHSWLRHNRWRHLHWIGSGASDSVLKSVGRLKIEKSGDSICLVKPSWTSGPELEKRSRNSFD